MIASNSIRHVYTSLGDGRALKSPLLVWPESLSRPELFNSPFLAMEAVKIHQTRPTTRVEFDVPDAVLPVNGEHFLEDVRHYFLTLVINRLSCACFPPSSASYWLLSASFDLPLFLRVLFSDLYG